MEIVKSSSFPQKDNLLISSPKLYPRIGSILYEMNWEFLICMLYLSYVFFWFVYLMRQIGGEGLLGTVYVILLLVLEF